MESERGSVRDRNRREVSQSEGDVKKTKTVKPKKAVGKQPSALVSDCDFRIPADHTALYFGDGKPEAPTLFQVKGGAEVNLSGYAIIPRRDFTRLQDEARLSAETKFNLKMCRRAIKAMLEDSGDAS